MQRVFLCAIVLVAMPRVAAAQTASSDTQTLQALLSEVRGLRQELRASLNRTQTMQILLVRFQMQEGAVARASERLNGARQKLLDAQVNQKQLGVEVKRLQDALDADQDPQHQEDLQDRIKHVKSDLEIAGGIAQQQQTAEIQAERQLRDEQDKLSALEGQLDELFRAMGSSAERPGPTK